MDPIAFTPPPLELPDQPGWQDRLPPGLGEALVQAVQDIGTLVRAAARIHEQTDFYSRDALIELSMAAYDVRRMPEHFPPVLRLTLRQLDAPRPETGAIPSWVRAWLDDLERVRRALEDIQEENRDLEVHYRGPEAMRPRREEIAAAIAQADRVHRALAHWEEFARTVAAGPNHPGG